MIRLYRQPKHNEYFVIGADPAEGGDYSTFVAISKFNAEVVMVGQNKQESSQLGHELNHVGKWFNAKTGLYPAVAVERNVGGAAIYVLKQLNYPNLFRMPDTFTSTDMEMTENYGWVTSSATRPKMLDDLALALRQNAIKLYDKPLIEELNSFIRNKRTGKPEANVGSTDDLVMALAIAWQVYQVGQLPTELTWDQAAWEANNKQEQDWINGL